MATKAQWREAKIINTYDLLKRYDKVTGDAKHAIAISYSSNDGSRMSMGMLTGWYVWSPFFHTDPSNTRISGRGRAEFPTSFKGDRAEARILAGNKAVNWATEKYGITEWVKIPGFGSNLFPVEIAKWAEKFIKDFTANRSAPAPEKKNSVLDSEPGKFVLVEGDEEQEKLTEYKAQVVRWAVIRAEQIEREQKRATLRMRGIAGDLRRQADAIMRIADSADKNPASLEERIAEVLDELNSFNPNTATLIYALRNIRELREAKED